MARIPAKTLLCRKGLCFHRGNFVAQTRPASGVIVTLCIHAVPFAQRLNRT
jgi:hypothetical protein